MELCLVLDVIGHRPVCLGWEGVGLGFGGDLEEGSERLAGLGRECEDAGCWVEKGGGDDGWGGGREVCGGDGELGDEGLGADERDAVGEDVEGDGGEAAEEEEGPCVVDV